MTERGGKPPARSSACTAWQAHTSSQKKTLKNLTNPVNQLFMSFKKYL